MLAQTASRNKLLFSLNLSLLFFTCSPNTHATTLFGGVQHTDSMPPVSSQTESLPVAPAYTPMNGRSDIPPQQATPRVRIEWYQLPKAMAGKWYKKGDLTVSVTDLRTGMTTPVNRFTDDELVASWGHQYDKQGNIWHANVMPFERDGSTGGLPVRFFIVSLKARLNSATELISRTHSIITEGPAQAPTKVFQQESLNHYFVNNNEIVNRSSNRDFTYEGRPVRDGMLESKFVRVAAFQPTPTLAGVDLASSLANYLSTIEPQNNTTPTEQPFPSYEPQANQAIPLQSAPQEGAPVQRIPQQSTQQIPEQIPQPAPQFPRVPEPQQ